MGSFTPPEDPDFWRNLVTHAPTQVLLISPEGIITYVNWVVRGLMVDEVIGRSVYEFVPEHDKAVIRGAIARVIETRSPAEYYVYAIGNDGRSAWYATRLGPIAPDDTRQLLMVTMDITEQHKIENEMRERNEQLVAFLNHIPAIVWIKDADMRYVYVNEECARLAELPQSAWIGKRAADVWPAEMAAQFDETNRRALETGEDMRVLETTTLNGVTRHWLSSKFRLQGPSGNLVGGMALDVTETKRAERERQELDLKLFETQKLESLGVLAGGVAHDFNNLLAIILGNINIARWHVERNISIEPQLQTIESIAMQAAAICRQLLTYAGRKEVEKTFVDLNRALLDVRELLRSSWKPTARVTEALHPSLPLVSGDDVQLRQIFLNLLMNALEAVGINDGEIRLATGPIEIDGQSAGLEITPPLEPGSYVFAAIEDNGCGMSAQTRARIFDPFFSTKFTGRGLGLAAVMGIVRNHKGGMRVQTEPGRGSTFTVYLPRYAPR